MKKPNNILFLISLILSVLLCGCAEKSGSNVIELDRKPENSIAQDIPESAPQKDEEEIRPVVFEGYDINGNPVSSAIFSQSKLTMVNVWATYCNPCLREMPGLGELAGDYEPEEFQVVGIISDVLEDDGEMSDLAAELIEQTGADYTHLLLNESIYYALLTDVTAVPTTFFVDENGVIADTLVGSMEKSAWEEKVNELLENR